MSNKNKEIHQHILEEEYARLRAKQRLAENLTREDEQPATNSQNPSTVVLKKLSEEIAALKKEKDQLVMTKQVLMHRITELVENERNQNQQLKEEILELRQECETLKTAMEMPNAP